MTPVTESLFDLIHFVAATPLGEEHRRFWFDWNYLVLIGLLGNATFSMRFIIQWIASEKAGESVIPVSFWYWSIGGSLILSIYFIAQRDPVGVLASAPNSFVYLRNLALIRKKKRAATAAAPTQSPAEATGDAGDPYVR